MKRVLAFIFLFYLLTMQGECQERYLKLDICETIIPFSFEMGARISLSDDRTLLVCFEDSLSSFSVFLLDSNLNITLSGKYNLCDFPHPTQRIGEDLVTGAKKYYNYLVYNATRSGTWIYLNQSLDIYKKEEY